jgi:hypothetical protein
MKRPLILPVLLFTLFVGAPAFSADFQKSIILGTSPYKLMKTTVDLIANVENKKNYMSFIFKHSLKILSNNINFSLSFQGCDPDLNLESLDSSAKKEILTVCNLAKDTNIVFTGNTLKNTRSYKLSNPSHGTANFDIEYKSNNFKLEGKIDLRNIPIYDQYQSLMAKVSLRDMSSSFYVQKNNGERFSGKIFIAGGKINLILDGIKTIIDGKDMPVEFKLILKKFPAIYKKWLKNLNKSNYYFGGMKVKQGQVLKADVLSQFSDYQPNSIKGYRVNGKYFYRGREVVGMDPIIDLDTVNDLINNDKDLPNSNMSFTGGDGLIYVDSITGVPVYLHYSLDFSQENRKVLGFQIIMNTNIHNPETAKQLSVEEAKGECALIGFESGSEKFADCVMKLIN